MLYNGHLVIADTFLKDRYIHTHIHTYIDTYIDTHTHTYTHKNALKNIWWTLSTKLGAVPQINPRFGTNTLHNLHGHSLHIHCLTSELFNKCLNESWTLVYGLDLCLYPNAVSLWLSILLQDLFIYCFYKATVGGENRFFSIRAASSTPVYQLR